MRADYSIFEALHNAASSGVILTGAVFFFAAVLPYLMVAASFVFLMTLKGRLRKFIFWHALLAVFLIRGVLVYGLQYFFPVDRPFDVLGFDPITTPWGVSSFPSGHASAFSAFAVSLGAYSRAFGGWMLALVILNGVARIAAGAHWPADVFFGIVIGVLGGLIINRLLRDYINKLK